MIDLTTSAILLSIINLMALSIVVYNIFLGKRLDKQAKEINKKFDEITTEFNQNIKKHGQH